MERRLFEIVRAEDEGLALGSFLRSRMGLSKKEISQAKFRENGICVDGRRQKVTAVLRAGQRVDVLLDVGARTSPQLKSADKGLQVLYEDQDVIAVDKPAGLSVHPAGREGLHGDTLANRLAFYLREKGEDCVIRIFGRLDQDTSGVVLAAKNQTAAARLARQREAGTLRKTYLAVCEGIPKEREGEISLPLGPDLEDRTRMRVCPAGRPARTRYQVLNTLRIEGESMESGAKPCALVRLQLDTGRMHQIRVHMASIGCPLLGDPLYGDSGTKGGGQTAPAIGRTALHAAELVFCQPFTGEELRIRAPFPKDIARLLSFVVE